MAYELCGQRYGGWIAGSDLSTFIHRFVAVDATNTVDAPAAGARCVGVCLNGPAAGDAADVQLDGIAKVRAGGVIAAGAPVAAAIDGDAVAAATGNVVMGIALEDGVADRLISVLLAPAGGGIQPA